MVQMDSNTHSSPFISIISGYVFGIIAFVSEHGFVIDSIIELIKVILFGFVGGVFGYLGREFIRLMIKKMKK